MRRQAVRRALCGVALIILYNLIPQNSKRLSESEKGTNPAIAMSECKAEFTCMISKMTFNQNQIVNDCPNSSALDRAVTNGHIIPFLLCPQTNGNTPQSRPSLRSGKLTA